MAHDVFVSYSTKDKLTADAICAALEANGIRCWIAPRDILPGSDWGEAIIDAIHACRAMVLVFSGSSNASSQIKREIERAVNVGIPVVPFRIEDVLPSKTLEYFISTQHWLDALTPPLEQHLQYLSTTMRAMLAQKVDGSEAEVREPRLKPQPAAAAAPEPPPATAAAPAPAAGAPGRKFASPVVIGILVLAVAVVTLAGVLWKRGGPPTTPPVAEETLCNMGNIYAVQNGPTSPATFTTTKAYKITYFKTYHWNYGRGVPGGTVGLRSSDGVTYGPWQVSTTPGQGGVPDANWIATPNVVIPPGTYTVIDSDPSTWAQNSSSGGRGFAEIRGQEDKTKAAVKPPTAETQGPVILPPTPPKGETTGAKQEPLPPQPPQPVQDPLGWFQVGRQWTIDWQSQFHYQGVLQIQQQLAANRYLSRITVSFTNKNREITVSMDGLLTIQGKNVVIRCSNPSASWWDTDDFYLEWNNDTMTGYNIDIKGRRGVAVFRFVEDFSRNIAGTWEGGLVDGERSTYEVTQTRNKIKWEGRGKYDGHDWGHTGTGTIRGEEISASFEDTAGSYYKSKGSVKGTISEDGNSIYWSGFNPHELRWRRKSK